MGTALTAVDLKALRTADDLVFRCIDGASTIKCIKRVTGDPWQTEKYYSIDVESHGAKDASEFCNSSQYHEEMRTTLKHLKVGDLLTLAWHKDYGSNGYAKAASHDGSYVEAYHDTVSSFQCLHVDVLRLEVRKEGKEGKDVYHLATSICPNNSARMIRA